MNNKKIIFFSLSTVFLFSALFVVFGWVEPTSNILTGYSAPINAASNAQTKTGNLTFSAVYDYNNVAYYVNPSNSNSGNFAGKIISNTSTLQTDPDKTLVTKDYVDNACILIPYATACPTGYSSLSGIASTGGVNKMCCRV